MTTPKSNSLLRRFSIFYVGFALIPIIVLFYLHSLYDETGSFIRISDTHFSLLLVLVGIISLIGFVGMHTALRRIVTFKLFAPPLVFTPLIYRGKTWGVLCLSGNRYGGNFSDDDLTIVSNLSHQIAISFENAKLNEDAEQTYFETMAALAMAVEARDPSCVRRENRCRGRPLSV